MGLLAAAIGAVAAFQVFAPSGDIARRDPARPVPAPVPAGVTAIGPTVAVPVPLLRFRPLSPADAYRANAAIPASSVPDPAARPFAAAGATGSDRTLASTCLTQAVYYEAASESLEGQRAVAQVVLNRVRDGRYPTTVCGVVFQGAALSTGCQFSFTCDGSMRRRPAAGPWRRAHAVAEAALDGFVMAAVGHATHYHTAWVTPYWSPTLVKLGRIGAHIFYRWGERPDAPATQTVAYAGGETLPDVDAEPSAAPAAAPATEPAEPSPPPAAPVRGRPPEDPSPAVRTLPEPPAPVEPPYRAASRRLSIDSPGFASRDQGR